ncbi:MAG TPA: AAA family ATPase [Gemmatimonadaceae bacterium]|nr:AAA family ATPase [Gemmatimonadaceae bacterium]
MSLTARRPGALGTLPLVGRENELDTLTRALDAAERGSPSTIFLAGEGGIGKTRLAEATVANAARRGWSTAVGRAYPVETGVPYALFSDALLPTLRALDAGSLAVLSRGGEAELARLFPALDLKSDSRTTSRGDAADQKARLLWNFSQFLGRFAAKRPLLIVLENLQWADDSSLELLHFTARQLAGHRIVILCSYNDAQRESNPTLARTERSLLGLGVASVVRLTPLTRSESDELLASAFDIDPAVMSRFAALLYERTQGNPFFTEEMLKALVDSGKLRREGDRWTGWDVIQFDLPHTVRDAIVARLERLSAAARTVANLAAVLGSRVSYGVLAAVSDLPADALVGAIDELRRERMLADAESTEGVYYDFTHPTLQATLYGELGRARVRLLHGRLAVALEQLYGATADAHADELALHFSRAASPELAPKAARYLAAAGRTALGRYANREAASYLSSALEIADRAGEAPIDDVSRLIEDLARARQRNGEYEAAGMLWARALEHATQRNDVGRISLLQRRLGLTSFWAGQHDAAFAHYAASLAAAGRAGDERLAARVRIAQTGAYQELGRADDALRELVEALAIAERLADAGMLARIHRALMQLHMFAGRGAEARTHGERAIRFAGLSAERAVEWSAHWGIAVLAGLTGNASELARHVREAERIAEDVGSPVLGAWTSEVLIEYASGIGDWQTGLALAERTIPIARAIGSRTLLPRLLVWTGLMHLGRGDHQIAEACFQESWSLSGAADALRRPHDVHTVVPAHTGMAAYALATNNRARAIELGEAGVALADQSGYVAWSMHRLIPIIIEAALWLQDFERAKHYGDRLRRDSAKMGHALGLAWASASDALVARLRDNDMPRAVELLRSAADQLDAVPFVFDAARVRRNLAQLLATLGDREGATRELRRAHDVFARIGAATELSAVRDQLRELGARPPARVVTEGAGALTGREREIAQLVAARKSNKEIGATLGISSRTVSTHLSNVFAKLGVTSRGELTDRVRDDETLRS